MILLLFSPERSDKTTHRSCPDDDNSHLGWPLSPSHIQSVMFICFILIADPHLQKQKNTSHVQGAKTYCCKEPDFLKREGGDSLSGCGRCDRV